MMLRFLLGIFVLSLVCVSVSFSPAWADQSQSTPAIHRVKKGDTLYAIARKAHMSVAELKSLNHLSGNKIKPGQRLTLAKTATEAIESAPTACSHPALSHEKKSLLEKTALSFLNMPYRLGGTGKKGIDCSGFVRLVFKSFNFELPHSARQQYTLGTKVAKSDLQVGDLLFFRTYAKYPSHVGIYLGNNKMIHASYRDRSVIVSSINSGYFRNRYIGARRLALTQQNDRKSSNNVLFGDPKEVDRDTLESSEHSPKDAGQDING